jgi:hypothetical protein
MPTMYAQNLYGGSGSLSGQETTNANGAAKSSTATPEGKWGAAPNLPGKAASMGASVPMLVAMGVLAWWLFRQY